MRCAFAILIMFVALAAPAQEIQTNTFRFLYPQAAAEDLVFYVAVSEDLVTWEPRWAFTIGVATRQPVAFYRAGVDFIMAPPFDGSGTVSAPSPAPMLTLTAGSKRGKR